MRVRELIGLLVSRDQEAEVYLDMGTAGHGFSAVTGLADEDRYDDNVVIEGED